MINRIFQINRLHILVFLLLLVTQAQAANKTPVDDVRAKAVYSIKQLGIISKKISEDPFNPCKRQAHRLIHDIYYKHGLKDLNKMLKEGDSYKSSKEYNSAFEKYVDIKEIVTEHVEQFDIMDCRHN